MLSLITLIWILCPISSCGAQTQPKCKSSLLSNLSDAAFTASSNFAPAYSAVSARLSAGDEGLEDRAWCPKNVQPGEEKEFVEVDLGQQSLVKLIITMGLSTAGKGGLYLTPFYYILYRREISSSTWIKYQNINGTTRIKGNFDAQTEHYVSMNPPFVARWVRIYPFTQEPQPVCLKLEIVGCSAHGVVEYQAPRGNYINKPPDDRLVDLTYDNPESRLSRIMEFHQDVFNAGGLGKLIDGKPDHGVDIDPLASNDFVGWKRSDDTSGTTEYERIVFRFDGIYNFSRVDILLANKVGAEVSRPRLIEVRLSRKFPRASSTDPATTLTAVHQLPILETLHPKTEWVHINLLGSPLDLSNTTVSSKYYNSLALFVELRIYYAGIWIALSEVTFVNVRAQLPPGLILDKDPFEASTTSLLPYSRKSSLGVSSSHYDLTTMQPHTYALVVGLGCLATVLIVLVLVLFVHWRRRAVLSKHKMDQLNHSFQHPFTMPQIKAAAQPTVSINAEADQKWEFYNSNVVQVPMYLNSENTAYIPSSTSVMPQFLLQQPTMGMPNSLMLPNYLRTQIQSNQPNEPSAQDQAENSGGDNEPRAPLFSFSQSVSSALTPESSAVYTTVSESDPYVNGTPRPSQLLRIPPPPSLPLPPTPTQPHSVADHAPQWPATLFSREKDYIQHHELNSSGNNHLNTLYRYSIPLNGVVYSTPIWVAGTMDPASIGHFYGQQQPTSGEHHALPQETPELSEYLSGTPVSSIIYGGSYGLRDPHQNQADHTPGGLSN